MQNARGDEKWAINFTIPERKREHWHQLDANGVTVLKHVIIYFRDKGVDLLNRVHVATFNDVKCNDWLVCTECLNSWTTASCSRILFRDLIHLISFRVKQIGNFTLFYRTFGDRSTWTPLLERRTRLLRNKSGSYYHELPYLYITLQGRHNFCTRTVLQACLVVTPYCAGPHRY